MPKLTDRERLHRIALLVSISCVLQISESMIPHPVPGLRLGLANMVALVALVSMGTRAAIEVALYRTLISSLLMGTFMSPTFILSFSAALASTAAMGFFHRLSVTRWRYGFSIIGISIAGALTHNLVQLFLAYLILVKHTGIFVLFPWLAIGAVATGWITGLVAGGVCRRLEEGPAATASPSPAGAAETAPLAARGYLAGDSFLHRTPPAVKIGALFVLAATVLFCASGGAFALLFLMLGACIAAAKIPFFAVLGRVRKYAFLVILAVALPILFNAGVRVLFSIGTFHVTAEGLTTGLTLGLRILFLIAASSLTLMTTAPEEMTAGLTRLLSPLRYVGIPEDRIATVFTLAWASIPDMWDAARTAIRSENFRKEAGIRNMIPLISGVIATLYLEATPRGGTGKGALRREGAEITREPPAPDRAREAGN